ncbi:MAG: Phage protein, partial [Gammaproteobacteria bacterium]|nr:Phage protein [Gammaproteobacteria bacterium]
MPIAALTDEELLARVALRNQHPTAAAAARAAGIIPETFKSQLKMAAKRGLMLSHAPAMPGFEISKVTTAPDGGQHITQKTERGDVFEMPKTHFLGKMTVQRDPDGRVLQDWIRVMPGAVDPLEVAEALKA